MAKKLEKYTIEELEALIEVNANKRRELKQEALEYQARVDQLKAEAKFAKMTPAEKAALAQSIRNAGGIETLEGVGEPGS